MQSEPVPTHENPSHHLLANLLVRDQTQPRPWHNIPSSHTKPTAIIRPAPPRPQPKSSLIVDGTSPSYTRNPAPSFAGVPLAPIETLPHRLLGSPSPPSKPCPVIRRGPPRPRRNPALSFLEVSLSPVEMLPHRLPRFPSPRSEPGCVTVGAYSHPHVNSVRSLLSDSLVVPRSEPIVGGSCTSSTAEVQPVVRRDRSLSFCCGWPLSPHSNNAPIRHQWIIRLISSRTRTCHSQRLIHLVL